MSDAWAAGAELTAILITVPELAEYTERWRSVSRSTARPQVPLTELIPPHVTVLVPWVAEPTDTDLARLQAAVASIEPFELSFPTAGQFPNGTAWLKPEPFDKVRAILLSVFDAFPECPPYGGEFPDAFGDPLLRDQDAVDVASHPPTLTQANERGEPSRL